MTYFKGLSFICILGVSLAVSLSLSKPGISVPAIAKSSDGKFIEGYKKWTKVNSEPFPVQSQLAQLCRMPTREDVNGEALNPHLDKFVVVFVNPMGRAAMMEQRQPHFPEGSIIVKEKLSTRESTSPELLTVMRKRAPGYDPEKGDWEYFVFDGAGQEMKASGKLETCQGCHVKEKSTDYVSRRYISTETWEKMK